ncbi:zinc finger BED domain-containing protein DAYSLEEPER-like isoform X1 [Papaver somniferum]|uniref:zinc finger BED domain-containing protein DAYSLEEPER-like isoform X1 n=1 Tax=Papaver somniferum TaxID=3469 RepID=UPI000E6FC5EF|nr:zinc finger BED domain-containing protein DAYSLEEPER-like isoform X1 [Papaver somniferum]XP_026398541.1 zinc finger BED domain-containing protein DAYSLEEPER-like isoform X1 [Papaver somniferum]
MMEVVKFFETAPDGKSRNCKFCKQSYPIATAFGNLGRHLKYYHPGYDKMDDAISSLSPQPITIISSLGDANARPSPQPITNGRETADKNGGAAPRSSLQSITSELQSADKMGDAISSLSPQSITTVSNRDVEPKSTPEIAIVTEVASLYLKFFETAPDGKSRSCRFCNQSYPNPTAYGNLGRHLKYRHPEYEKMGDFLSSSSLRHTATVAERADKTGDAIPSPSPSPIATVAGITEKKGEAVPRQSLLPITTVTKTADRGNIRAAKPTEDSVTSFFEISSDGMSQSCKFCNLSYSIATAIGNLQRHLKHRHPDEYDKMGDTVSNTSTQLVTTASKSSTVDLDNLNWLLLRWLIGGSFPPSALQDKWLSNSFKFVNPMVKLWSNERLQAIIREVFKSTQEDVKASLELVNSKISLTLDFWTSYQQIFYMSITCHWIDESWSLHKVLLDILRIPLSCAGADIYRVIVKVLKIYNIGNKILSCTHDNSQKTIHACHKLKAYLDGQNSMAFCYIPCAARTLNLIIEDGLRNAKPVISKIREFVLELNMSPAISSDFKQTASAYQEGSWEFPIDISTRWSGSYAMLDIACKASKSMDVVIRKHADTLDGSYMLLNPGEKVSVSIMHLFLEPFQKTANNICTSKFPTVGLVLVFMDHVFEMIAACRGSRNTPDWLKNCAEDMAIKGKIYNDQVHNLYTYMAIILDPRFKVGLIPERFKLESNLKEARDHFMRHYSTTHFPTPANGYSTQEKEDGGNWKRRRVDMPTSTDELSQYLSEAPSPITTDILDWWKRNSSKYPRLSVMARDFLAVQSTSVSPDEAFSEKGDEVDNQRFCLPHGSTQPVLCMKAWSESGFKLKYRSAEVNFEKLMEPVMRS